MPAEDLCDAAIGPIACNGEIEPPLKVMRLGVCAQEKQADVDLIQVSQIVSAPVKEAAEQGMVDALKKREEEETRIAAQLQELKKDRLDQAMGQMDEQMRRWCRELASRKCQGEPWQNVGGSKLRTLEFPALDAGSSDVGYIPPGATFGVEEVRAGPDRVPGSQWLKLVTGGWVLDHSRKLGREKKRVANRAEHHQEMVGEEVFEIGPHEDRREAYTRMVHRRSEADLLMPDSFVIDLMPYQVEGVEWLVSLFNNDLGGLLADEMGLGKTIQTVALMALLKENKKRYGPHLIVCPKSVLSNWDKEISRCFPEFQDYLVVFQGNPAQREELAKKIRKAMKKNKKKLIVVTNYEQVHPERNKVLHEPCWELIVVDEGHRMKNQKSVFHQTMKNCLRGRMKLLLTGTPLQNNLDELFSLLHYLLPEIFTEASSFKSWFAAPFLPQLEAMGANEYYLNFTEEEEQALISNLHAMLAPFLLQRTKADALNADRLPPRKEITIRVPLSAWQEHIYQDLHAQCLRRLSSDGSQASPQLLRNTSMQLRKAALHPLLFGNAVGGRSRAEDLVKGSGKLEALDRLLTKLERFKHRVLIFSQFTSMLDLIQELLSLRQHTYERIDGQVSAEDRQAKINRFSDPAATSFVFLLSSRAGAVGLNLQAADTVILFDLDWNPQNDKQAIARAHRIGQTKEVLVIRLLTTSPIEEHMQRRALEKLELEQKIIGAGSFSKKGQAKTPEERAEQIKELLGLNGDVSELPVVLPTSFKETNELIARSEDELQAFRETDASMGLQGGDSDVPGSLMRVSRLISHDAVPAAFEAIRENSDSE